ncbi:MAG: hypothetical protein KPEEDBHJ_01309 [Anaerolineales bacterium]|nr:hypothetical protein [Anaerolineales bacterium]
MNDVLPVYALWFSVALSMTLSVFGLAKDKWQSLLAGAVLFLPFIFYFSGYPAARTVIILPFLHFGSTYALYKKNRMMAWSLFSPALFFILFVLAIVFVNQAGSQ